LPYNKQTQACTVAQKAIGYGMPGIQVDGNDAFAVYRVVSEALARARAGEGPTLIEAHTYRVTDHTTSDDATRYRAEQEVEVWRQRDPILRLARYMKRVGLLDDDAEAAAQQRAEQEVAVAVAAFEAFGVPGPEEIFAHVYAEMTGPLIEQQAELARRVALREGRG
jgi:2-oxoisovalerate dehydrogenase E1 component alpha subunit